MTYKLLPGVSVGEGAELGDYVVIGEAPRSVSGPNPPTVLGRRAVVRSHTVIYAGNQIGDDFQTGHGVLVRESNTIGARVSIGSHSIVEHHVVIGDDVRIHSNVFVPEFSVLEDGCWLGPGVILTNARYPRSAGVKEALRGPLVRCGAKIGAGAVLLPGTTIGRDALVGAGAVVVADVPDGAVVVGNPARVVRQVSDIEAYRALRIEDQA